MDFYKKLKASKPSGTEILVTNNILSEIERKLIDMQPVMQEPTTSKLEVQKTIMEIKSHVDSLKDLGGSVTAEQQDRIKEITRKYKEISVKHSYISENSAKAPNSPRPFRKKLPETNKELPQNNPVFKLEVEETLKVMRQKRLDRLSVFVAEQSKLSEERSNKNKDSDEIEDAIKSIQKTEIDNKTSLRSIVEGNLRHNKVIKEEVEEESPKLGRTRSNESSEKFKNGKSSTLKLINKLNCTVPFSSSNEDLTGDVYNKVVSVTKGTEDGNTYPNANVSESEGIDQAHLDHTNVLLSPRGKQRRAVYMYEHECQFLENEKRSSLPSLSTFGKEASQGDVSKKDDIKNKIHTYENTEIIVKNQSLAKFEADKLPDKENTVWENTFVRTKINHIYENSEIIANRSSHRSSIKSRNSLENIGNADIEKVNVSLEEKKIEHIEKEDKTTFGGIKKLPKLNLRSDLGSRKKFNRVENPRSPLKSPLPLPRRNNYAERILKKVQRNWETLEEIIDNDSDIDCDEVEDLKRTWEEANVLLTEYKTKVSKLDRKSKEEANTEKLIDINAQLVTIEEEVTKFKGLKRDSSYMQLSSRLSNYFLDVSKMTFSVNDAISKKQNTLDEINSLIKRLEKRVNKNEAMLMEILDMQVRSIGTNVLCITKV